MSKVSGTIRVSDNYRASVAGFKVVASRMSAEQVENAYQTRFNEDENTVFQRQPTYLDPEGNLHAGGSYLFRVKDDPSGKNPTQYEWIDTTNGSILHDVKAGYREKPIFKTREMIQVELAKLREMEEKEREKKVREKDVDGDGIPDKNQPRSFKSSSITLDYAYRDELLHELKHENVPSHVMSRVADITSDDAYTPDNVATKGDAILRSIREHNSNQSEPKNAIANLISKAEGIGEEEISGCEKDCPICD